MQDGPNFNELFERRQTLPDIDARERLARLIGIEDQKSRLAKMLSLLINPADLEAWAKKFHPNANSIVAAVTNRPPLVVLAGDVGSGKTELAETIGDAVARNLGLDITLLPLSLSSRGEGRVGEMTQLLSAAFDYTVSEAIKLKGNNGPARGGLILLVDEADALAQSREMAQMHHEDRAGVNTFIRGVDQIAHAGVPAAVVTCTNRLNALDPAVKRRAADILAFSRPNDEQRRAFLQPALSEIGLSTTVIDEIVSATGPDQARDYGFTFSDLTQRLLPSIVLDAYPTQAVEPKQALDIARRTVPTPPFKEEF